MLVSMMLWTPQVTSAGHKTPEYPEPVTETPFQFFPMSSPYPEPETPQPTPVPDWSDYTNYAYITLGMEVYFHCASCSVLYKQNYSGLATVLYQPDQQWIPALTDLTYFGMSDGIPVYKGDFKWLSSINCTELDFSEAYVSIISPFIETIWAENLSDYSYMECWQFLPLVTNE